MVLLVIGLLVWLRPIRSKHNPVLLIALCATLLVLTGIFDSLIIALHIVAYNPERILGLRIGKAPIEDFAYTIAASLLIPYLWTRSGDNE
jgi:lycopene cyclase domain-containing protein